MSQNWRTEINAQDYFGHQQKQLEIADRRPVIRRASDLVGPGINQNTARIVDFNDPIVTFNGFFSSIRSENGPNVNAVGPDEGFDTHRYIGFVSSDAEIGGIQIFYDLANGTQYRRLFTRNPTDPGNANAITWGSWA